jgi:hypothetical protein
VLLHGLAGHAGEWEVVASRLIARYRVVADDQRGHGASERHPYARTSTSTCSSSFDEDTLALGQDSVVGGVPGDPEPFGDTGDGEVLADNGFKRPPQPAARELRPRLSRLGCVLPPHVPAVMQR